MNYISTEICVDSLDSAIIAEEAGADEIEMCQALNVGGLTPSYGFAREIKHRVSVPINMMIRPRSGDFVYSQQEKNIMLRDIDLASKEKIDGIVIGALLPDGNIDVEFMKECMEMAPSLWVTFSRAFDMVPNREKALNDLIELGVNRVLTSGGRQSAFEGRDQIRTLVNLSRGRIEIMAGAGINEDNVKKLVEDTDIRYIHFSAKETVKSNMEYKNKNVNMGGNVEISEYSNEYTNKEKAEAIIDRLGDIIL